MLKLVLVAVIVFILLLIAEYMWRIKHYYSEVTRKFVHITVGTFAAFWPWILTWDQIELLAGAFLIGVLLARTFTILTRVFSIFGSVHIIGRKTLGELFFSLGIGTTALISHNRYVFMAAILQLSIADALAAIIGTRFGKRHRYHVFGQPKSVAGSLTFLVCSVVILGFYFAFSHHSALPTIIWLPLVVTALENVGIRGSDNLLVPVVVAVALRLFT
jgi:dolichol kinase